MHDFDEDLDEALVEGDNRKDDVDGIAANEPSILSFAIAEMEKEHVIEENYMTDEFDSGPDEDKCEDMHALIRFNEEEPVTKNFTFKVGMGFSSMNQFNKTTIEFNILNDKEVRFSKKDTIR